MITANDIITIARSQLGVPFRHQGRLPGVGLDCAGLAAYVAGQIGAEFNEWPGYGRTPHKGLLESVLDNQPCLDQVTTMQAGDVLLMRFTKEPQHVALCAGQTIIHCYSDAGGVVEHDLSTLWTSRIVKIYRFKGIAE